MESKLKCPFCQQELREIYFNGVGVGYICPTPYCKKAEKLKGNAEFWQALTQAKQDLEIAVDALNAIIATPLNSRVIHDTANKALKQIEHKE